MGHSLYMTHVTYPDLVTHMTMTHDHDPLTHCQLGRSTSMNVTKLIIAKNACFISQMGKVIKIVHEILLT